MKYLLFDQSAVSILANRIEYQSIEYESGAKLVKHLCGELTSQTYPTISIKYTDNGVLFVGKRNPNQKDDVKKIYVIDLDYCNILSECRKPADLLMIMQKSFRLAIKAWTNQPFSFSERIHGSKSILFPFTMPDARRLVIERFVHEKRLDNRGIGFTLLAYKYSADDPPNGEEHVDTHNLRLAGEDYLEVYAGIQLSFVQYNVSQQGERSDSRVVNNVMTGDNSIDDEVFEYLEPEQQRKMLTTPQQAIVDSKSISTPIRIEGAAGTGKTAAMILRAYTLLENHQKEDEPFKAIFISHSISTMRKCKEMFSRYPNSEIYQNSSSPQYILFTTLLDYCCEYSHISLSEVIEGNADDAKTYQLMLIDESVQQVVLDALSKAKQSGKVNTYLPLLTKELSDLFDPNLTPNTVLVSMLQHEFSIQIKSRANCDRDEYVLLESIENGIPCKTKRDKEFIFGLFTNYQDRLRELGCYDIDDITLETLARLNGPLWRRRRQTEGYDYIFVDEMHLFNVNEQSVFHYLSTSSQHESIPLCFALDYSQAIGDRGNTEQDYFEKRYSVNAEKQQLKTVFRNSPPIADFCAAIAASGTLMFQSSFHNPYQHTQNIHTADEEQKSGKPQLYMYDDEQSMIEGLAVTIEAIMKKLQCRKHEVAIISFDRKYITTDGIRYLSEVCGKEFVLINRDSSIHKDAFVITSPYDVNGLEFSAVILLGVDDGRVPQKSGVTDISNHYILYSAYNLLYLSASRAKYQLKILGNKASGISPCLDFAIENGYLEQRQ